MIKTKLKKMREQKFTQEEFAHLLKMETSNYNRRENGIKKLANENGIKWQNY